MKRVSPPVSQRPSVPPHGWPLPAVMLAVGILGASLACSVERDYRTLSFFFDGVPDPNAEPDRLQSGPGGGSLDGSEVAPDLPPEPSGSVHTPYANRECEGCHIFAKADADRPAWLLGRPKLLVPVEELCIRCHESPEDTYVHGPVAIMRCDLCHMVHDSNFPNLLKLESVNKSCLACHMGETFETQEAHGDLEVRDCCTCHDPHSANNISLLKAGAPSLEEAAEAWEEPAESEVDVEVDEGP